MKERKRLVLKKERLRNLSPRQLQSVAGGNVTREVEALTYSDESCPSVPFLFCILPPSFIIFGC